MSQIWLKSSTSSPCPVCGRTKDNDCRWHFDFSVILCHTYQDGPDTAGFKYAGHSEKGAGWGKFYKPFEKPPRPKAETYFDYYNRDGSPLVRVQRKDLGNGKKEFYQQHWNGSGWSNGAGDRRAEIPIYRYSQVRAAIDEGKEIFWVEGEATVDSLWQIGIPATTTIGGSGGLSNYGKQYRDDVACGSVVICPDRDEEGLKYAKAVEDLLGGSAGWCKAFPGSPEWGSLPKKNGADLKDWIDAGATKEQILNAVVRPEKPDPKSPDPEAEITHEELVNRIREYESQYGMGTSKYDFALYQLAKQIRIPKTAIEGIYLKSIADSVKREILPISELSDRHNTDTVREWLIERFLPKGTTCLLYADGGVGKTLLVYDLIKSLHERDSFLDRRIVYRPKTLLIQTDEPEIDMLQRFRDKGMDRIPNLFVTTEWTFGEIVNLKRTIEQEKYELVIIDSFASANRQALTEEKDAMHAAVLYELRNFANLTNCTIIVLHHTNKTGQARGSTAIRNNVSECWKLRKHDPNTDPFKMASDERILQVEKSRSGVIQKLIVSLNEDLDFEFVDDLQKRLEGGDSVPATWTERILAYFQNNTEAEETALSLPERWSLNGLKVETAKKTMKRMHSKGTLELVGKESNSKGEASSIYRLAGARGKTCPGVPVSPETFTEQGKQTGTDSGNISGTTGTESKPGQVSTTGTRENSVPDTVPVADSTANNGSSAYRDTGTQGQARVRENDPPKARTLGSLNQYTGPAIGSLVQLDPTDVDPKKIRTWRAKGSDLPWGLTATVIEVGSTGSRYVVTVELPDKRRFVVDDLNALGGIE